MRFTVRLARRAAIGAALACLLAAAGGTGAQDPPDPTADRVTLRYTESGFELVSLTSLVNVLPPSDELPGEVGTVSGFWFELRNAGGETLYRRIIGDPVRLVFEGPADENPMEAARISARRVPSDRKRSTRERQHDATLARALVTDRTGLLGFQPMQGRASSESEALAAPERTEAVPEERVFALLIPLAAQDDELVLFSSPIEVGSEAEAATEVARFVLRPAQP
jgi:hypothetical protein